MSMLLFVLAAATAPAEVTGATKPLYTFDNDTPGKSVCNGGCATAWPPLAAPADAKPVGKWTVIKRDDGSSQWAADGKPVYTFVQDIDGTPKGDGLRGVWHLVTK